MSVLEFQFRKQAFLDFFKAEINQRRLPFPTLDLFALPQLKGHLLERIECLSCSADATAGDGQVTLQVQLSIHYHTSLATIRAAGSLNPPVTEQVPITIPVVLSVQFVPRPGQAPQAQLQWVAAFGLFPPGVVPLKLPDGIDLKSGGVDASEDVIAIRLGTQADDPVRAPITSRIGNSDWSQLVPGQLIADQLAASLSASLASSLSNDLVLDKSPSGAWIPFALAFLPWKAPFAIALADVTAVDQCIFNIDISVSISLVAEFEVSGGELTTTLTLNWDADSTLCDVVGTLLLTPIAGIAIHVIAENKASDTILGTAQDPQRFHKTGQTDSSITYQSTSIITTPSGSFTLTHAEVNGDGLLATGTIQNRLAPRGLEGSVSAPRSGLHIDCHAKRVTVQFQPAQLYLQDIGIEGGPPRLFPPGVLFDPPEAWVAVQGVSNSWLDLLLTFVDPPKGRLPVGTATSVFIDTDCGVRWVDLGVIPAEHPPPTHGDVAQMISQCMAKSDPWGVKSVLNLSWLVDPPQLLHEIDPVRQWIVALQRMPEGVHLEFVAQGPQGAERFLGVLEGRQNVSAQITTNANETLQIRGGQHKSLPTPVVFQRWIIPFASVALHGAPTAVAAAGDIIGVRGATGETQVIKRGLNGAVSAHRVSRDAQSDPLVGRLMGTLAREEKRNRGAWATAAQLDRQTVGVIQGQKLLIGIAGPMSRM